MCPAKKSYKIKYATATPSVPFRFRRPLLWGDKLRLTCTKDKDSGRTSVHGFLSAGMVNVRTIHTESLKFEQVGTPALGKEDSSFQAMKTVSQINQKNFQSKKY